MSNKPRTARPRVERPVQRAVKRETVCVAFIHPGECSAYFATSMIAMLLHDQSTGRHINAILNEWSSANVSASRNSVTKTFLEEKDSDWLLWVDADMAWDHDALDRLLASADADTKPVMGGLCFGSNLDGLFPTIYQVVDRFGTLMTVRTKQYPTDTVHKCSATGAAFILIHRRVIKAMWDREFNLAFPWFQETEMDGKPVGEDITFCLRAGLVGMPVHVDTSVKIGHHKTHLLTEDLFRAQQDELPVPLDLVKEQ